MKSPVPWLPSLLVLAVALLLNCQTDSQATAAIMSSNHGDVRALEQQRKEITDRLERLETSQRRVLPRGGI